MNMKTTLFNNPRQFCVLFILITLSKDGGGQDFYEGDLCDFAGYEGVCMAESKCIDLPARMERLRLKNYNVGRCGFTLTEEMICCPNNPAPAQTPPAPLDPFKPFKFRPSPEVAIEMSSTTVLPPDFWFSTNFINKNDNDNKNKNMFNENQTPSPAPHADHAKTESVIGLFNNFSHEPKVQRAGDPTADLNKNTFSTEKLNQFLNKKPLLKEDANKRTQPQFNVSPLPPEIVNERVEGIFSGIPDPKHEVKNNLSITDELGKERINNLFHTNLTPANEKYASKDLTEEIIIKRINALFHNDNNKHPLPNENRVPDAVIKERLESILNARRITNTNRNDASNNMPNTGKANPEIKPSSRIDFNGIDGERPPPNNKSVRNGAGPPNNGTRVLNTYKDSICETKHYKGTCTGRPKCPHLNNYLKKLNLKESDVEYCAGEDTICCPKIERAADRACTALESIPTPHLDSHIFGGYKVGPTEYRHMANIVYDMDGPFCGGALIHKRFVLTAAHCILGRSGKPSKVILGVANLNDEEERAFRQDIAVKRTHVHEKYNSAKRYYDIGLLELAKDVAFSLTVYPTCLHTDQTELPDGTELTATGWGRTENQFHSDHLLAVKLKHIPISQCNQSYEGSIDPWRFDHGIDETQICAGAPGKDSCVGDSGGPLHLVVDPTHNKYRVVGVVSFGLSCGSAAPGVYTRVTEFLDFIEKVVWPAETEML